MLRTAVAACALLIAASASAQPESGPPDGPPPGGRHEGHGRPGGGPGRPRLFISPSGQPFRGGNGLADWLTKADADHDGAVTPAEFQADAEAWFQVLDANHDGIVDGFEITAYEREIAPEITSLGVEEGPGPRGGGPRGSGSGGSHHGGGMGRGGMGGGGMGGGGMGGGMGHGGGCGGRGGQGGGETTSTTDPGYMKPAGRQGAARFSLINEPEPILAADANIDGRVTQAEWRKATARRFGLLDKAGSGRLTRESLLAPPKPAKAP